jgi:hypothetical protein
MTTIDRETLEALQAKVLNTLQTLDRAIPGADGQKAIRKLTDARESAQRMIVGLSAADALTLTEEQAAAIGVKLDRLLAILEEKPAEKPSEGAKDAKPKPKAKRAAKPRAKRGGAGAN